MGFLTIIQRGLEAMIEEVKTSESIKKGKRFEEYVRHYLFPKEHYDLIDRTHRFDKNDFVESCLKPDFKFRNKVTKQEFYVEAKFRSNYNDGKLLTLKEGQLDRYRNYLSEARVYIVLGFGDHADDPKMVSLIRLENIKRNVIYWKEAKWFEINPRKPVIRLP